jgi:DNA-binding NtrC family response regulator
MTHKLLIIEDDASLSQMLTLHFEEQGFEVIVAFDCRSALPLAGKAQPDLMLLDQQLPDGLGNELLPKLLEITKNAQVIMMTGVHDLELAIQAIKDGAADFIHKPVKTEVLQQAVDQALAHRPTADTVQAGTPLPQIKGLVGRSEAMLQVSKDIALSAESAATVLITGESGTGKEVVARLIHQHSNRSGSFVAINCAAIVDTLLESELFGHEKGAFTGAAARKAGKFELAANGTLFLDEIGELAMPVQAKLLRALQERMIEPVGSIQSIATSARVIAATHKDLFREAAAENFREDLAWRLSVINIHLPPLRERMEDIPLLTRVLLDKAALHTEKPAPPITDESMHALMQYNWPGNVRELENTLTQALIQARNGEITPDLLSFKSRHPQPDALSMAVEPEAETECPCSLEQMEAIHVQKVLNHTGGHKGHSSRILGISRPALDRKIKKYGLTLPDQNPTTSHR